MSWKENRRRKRIWYSHYRRLCDELAEKVIDQAKPLRAQDIILMFYDTYERYRLHKRRKTANSALDSLRLAVADTGLDRIVLTPAQVAEVTVEVERAELEATRQPSDVDVP